jgi:hypothetical protein
MTMIIAQLPGVSPHHARWCGAGQHRCMAEADQPLPPRSWSPSWFLSFVALERINVEI